MVSDGGDAVLLYGGRFVPGGLHTMGDIFDLQMSLRSHKEPKRFDLPTAEIEELPHQNISSME